jgi:arylsulfatase A-like enzyme
MWPLEPPLPGANENNISDKPGWVQAHTKVNELRQRQIAARQQDTIMSVDDGVQSIIDALGPDRAANTLFVFLSDNGYMLGVHRLTGKDLPYAQSTDVPMMMRWDGHLPSGVVDNRIMLNIDLTATIADAAGASWPMEGRSWFGPPRDGTVLEQTKFSGHPAYCGWRNKRWLFVQYTGNQGRELYDYTTDPYELHNQAANPDYHAKLVELRNKSRAACKPTPPGFIWK